MGAGATSKAADLLPHRPPPPIEPVRRVTVINYTDALTTLVRDLIARVPAFNVIDPDAVLVFARASNARRHGLFAACHALNLSNEEPTHFVWRDRRSGRVVQQSPWFVHRSPDVTIRGRRLEYLVSFLLPRFCNETIALSPSRRRLYPDGEPWIARLDTVVHELFHMAPGVGGIRRMPRADGSPSRCAHGRAFHEQVAAIVRQYLASGADPATVQFLRYNFRSLTARFGGVTGLVFKTFPLYPRCTLHPVERAPAFDGVPVATIPASRQPTRYTEADLDVRQFMAAGSRWAPDARGECAVLRRLMTPAAPSHLTARPSVVVPTNPLASPPAPVLHSAPSHRRSDGPRQLSLF